MDSTARWAYSGVGVTSVVEAGPGRKLKEVAVLHARSADGSERIGATGLDAVDQLLSAICSERSDWASTIDGLRNRAAARSPAEPWVAQLVLVSEVLRSLALERVWTQGEVDVLVGAVAEACRVSVADAAFLLLHQVVGDPRLLSVAPTAAAEALLRLLCLLAPVREASLWAWGHGGSLAPVVHVGLQTPGRRLREVARATMLGDEALASARATVRGFPVETELGRVGALVIRVHGGRPSVAASAAREVAEAFRGVLELQRLTDGLPDHESSVMRVAESGLRRIGIDLHDGPVQKVAQLIGETTLFRRQMSESLPEGSLRDRLVGRVDDLAARIEAVNDELRTLARLYAFPIGETGLLGTALRDEFALFEARTGVRVRLDVHGDEEALVPAVKLAIVRIVQEAVRNSHRHGAADTVTVSIAIESGRAFVDIIDDGRGFNATKTLAQAAADGRLGVSGMTERTRLLGGRLTVTSHPGAGTRIRAVLPNRWPPRAAAGVTDGPLQGACDVQ